MDLTSSKFLLEAATDLSASLSIPSLEKIDEIFNIARNITYSPHAVAPRFFVTNNNKR